MGGVKAPHWARKEDREKGTWSANLPKWATGGGGGKNSSNLHISVLEAGIPTLLFPTSGKKCELLWLGVMCVCACSFGKRERECVCRSPYRSFCLRHEYLSCIPCGFPMSRFLASYSSISYVTHLIRKLATSTVVPSIVYGINAGVPLQDFSTHGDVLLLNVKRCECKVHSSLCSMIFSTFCSCV